MSTDEIDEYTGLPKVPEGYFWRVHPGVNKGYWIVDLRRRLFWGFSESIFWAVNSGPITESKVLDLALYVMRQAGHLIQPGGRAGSPLFGEYPPQKLGER